MNKANIKSDRDLQLKSEIDDIIIKQKKYRDPDFSARLLAERLAISTFQLARYLKKFYGKSYSDIILPLRIKDAKKYLNDPRKSIYTVEEIGIMVGFGNKWSFFQAFRKYVGMTPTEWKDSKNTPLV